MQIYPEPRRYGAPTGAIEQMETPWVGKRPETQARENGGKYALQELG